MIRKAAVGKQDFREIIESNYFYVDKTGFIKEWWENGDDVTLITRPRRFGKTLTMRMTEQFFSVKYAACGRIFHGLKIWEEEKYQKLQGTYPVIYLSFAIIKEDSFEKTKKKICQLIANLYADYTFLLKSDCLTENDKIFFSRVSADMDDVTATMALYQLSIALHNYYNKKVIILLDEYDTPMQEAYLKGYWEELIIFIRSLFNAAFKSNPCLERAIMTGITWVGKESIFSDLNNLKVVTVTSKSYASAFGFTEDEVSAALTEYGLAKKKEDVRQWYDGFTFGSCSHIYNPWSVVNFLAEREVAPYWANTSSNGLVKKLFRQRGKRFKIILEDLLIGKSFETALLNEEIIFSQLDHKESSAWSLLLACGYLKAMHVKRCPNGKKRYTLSITNTEVRTVFDEIVTEIFSSSESDYSEFSEALLLGDNMFGTLKMYHDKDFFQAHRKIQFDTLYETGLYEAVAVLKTRILNENEEGFRYYQFFNYQNEREFQKCLEFIEKNQMFGTDSTLEYGDHILMLSTCEYSQENGRLVIVARKMN